MLIAANVGHDKLSASRAVCGLEMVKVHSYWPEAWSCFLSLGLCPAQLALAHGSHPSQSSLTPLLLNFHGAKEWEQVPGLPFLSSGAEHPELPVGECARGSSQQTPSLEPQ